VKENLHPMRLMKTGLWRSLKAILNVLMLLMGLQNKNNKCTRIKYVLSHIINYQHVPIAFTIIIMVSLQSTVKPV